MGISLVNTFKKSAYMILDRLSVQILWAPNPFSLQRKLINKSDPVIFDIGAHTGGIAKKYRDEFTLASIHCFEPFPEAFQSLEENVKGEINTFCYRTAVSENVGKALLNSNNVSATNSLLATDENQNYWGNGLYKTIAQIEVDTTTIDAFCKDKGINHIDILKMDVQGSEYSILAGANEMLSKNKISLIYMELLMCPTYKGQYKLKDYLSYLDTFGYELYDFFNIVRNKKKILQVDGIFLDPSILQSN